MAAPATPDYIRDLMGQLRPYRIDTRRRPAPPAEPALAEPELVLPAQDAMTIPEESPPELPEPPKPDLSSQRQGMVDRRREDAARLPLENKIDTADFVGRVQESRKEARDADERASEKSETIKTGRALEEARRQQAQYDNDFRRWNSQREAAIEANDDVRVAELDKARPKPPELDLRATGGKTVEQIEVPVEKTLEEVKSIDPEAYAALMAIDTGTDAIDANFADISGVKPKDGPSPRLQAMLATGRRLAQSNANMDVVGLPSGVAGGMGRPGTKLMPPNRTQPRSDYDIRPGKPTGTPRSGMEDIDTGAPRRLPQHVDTFDGAMGPRAAPAPSTDAILAGIDIDAPEHTGREKERIIFAAHQMGLDLSAFDTSPRGQDMALAEAKRMVRDHQRRIGKRTEPVLDPETGAPVLDENGRPLTRTVQKQRIVASGNSDNPYRYAETPEAKEKRERADLLRRTYEYIGSHPLHDKADPTLHKRLLKAAESGDMATYQELRRQLRGMELMGQREMGVRRRAMTAATHQMTDPRIAPGVFAASMRDAAGDPEAQANLLMQYGMFDQANAVLGAAAQAAGMADARAARDRQLDNEEFAAKHPKGEAPQEDAITAIDNKLTQLAAEAAQSTGFESLADVKIVASTAKQDEGEMLRRYGRRFMKVKGASASHPVMQELMHREWKSIKTLSRNWAQQFVDNCVAHLGVSEADAINWLKTHQPSRLADLNSGGAAPPTDGAAGVSTPSIHPAGS